MDVCLPDDFHLVAGTRFSEGDSTDRDDDALWLGGEALIAALPAQTAAGPARRRRRTAVADDPSWQVV